MNGATWVTWGLVALLAVTSITFLMGKGSFLIADYNTDSKEEKEKRYVKKLLRVMIIGFGIIAIIMAINVSYRYEQQKSIKWLMSWGHLTTIAFMIVLANTICKKGMSQL